MAKVKVIHEKGKKSISFHPGGLHESTHTAPGNKISSEKIEEAKEGKFGAKAVKQVNFMRNVLTGGKK